MSVHWLLQGYKQLSEKDNWKLKQKLELMDQLGIGSKRIFLKIKKIEKLEASKLTKEQAEEILDTISIFIASTDKLIYELPQELIADYQNQGKIKISYNYLESKITMSSVSNKSEFSIADTKYLAFLKLLLKFGAGYKYRKST